MQLKSIQVKITLWAGLCLFIAGVGFLGYTTILTRNSAIEAAKKQATAQAQIEADRVRDQLEHALDVTKTLTQSLVSTKTSANASKISRENVNGMIKQVLIENPQFVALYSDWEPNAFDGADSQYGSKPGYNPDGRFNFTWSYDEKGEIKSDVTPPGDEEQSDWYQVPKKAMRESIIEPYPYVVQGKQVMETTLVTPILVNGKFLGVVGADIKIDFLQRLADSIDIYNHAGKLVLVSNKGAIGGLTGRPDAINKPLANILPELSGDLEKIRSGRQEAGFTGDNLRVLVPLSIGKTETPWAVIILIPSHVIAQEATALFWKQLLMFSILMAGALAVLWYLAGRLAEPIRVAARFASDLANGVMTARLTVTEHDETGQLLTAMNSMLDNSNSLVQSEESRNQLQQSIIRLLEQVSDVAQGDLSREVSVSGDVTGTIADSFNYMISELRRIIGQVQNVTQQVSVTANVTQNTTSELVREADDQTQQLNKTASAIQQMARSIQRVTDDALLSATVAQQSLNNARQGTMAVQNTIEGMQRIRDQVQETSKKLKRLGESSQEIGEIVQIIGGISKRTSYLALNAAIQAAEAGESGHGFTVVAEEIERLAKRSADATKRINNLVKTIQSGANEAISAMEDSTREVVDGSHLANQAGQALVEIQSVSQRLAELIESISKATEEQSESSIAVTAAMNRIADITQRTSEGIKRSSNSVHDLATLADELRESVASFKLPQRR